MNDKFIFGDATLLAHNGIESTLSLQRRPDAQRPLFFDFDGHHSAGNSWGHDLNFPLSSVMTIRTIFQIRN
ncbi:MAG: hypothetical protein CMM07_10495 [Rhodopirellula sp.]|nr:hypothetical protein [Rhodopirellula sp.]